jgi:hypothetical protein
MESGGGSNLQVSCFGDIKGDKGMQSGDREVGQAAHVFADCDVFCPEDRVCTGGPFHLVSIDGFE